MKRLIWLAAAALAACAQGEKAAAPKGPDLSTETGKFSYAVGRDVGRTLKNMGVKIDVAALAAGVEDTLSGKPSRVPEAELTKVKQKVFRARQAELEKQHRAQAKQNAEAAEKFLSQNAKKPDVRTTASGLQYQVLREGTGPSPKLGDTVVVHYEGRLTDGRVFDSSYQRGQPAQFVLAKGRLIPGWVEGLQLMKKGAKFRFWIPPALGYGERGAPPRIPPNAVLVFDVELLDVKQGQ